MTIESSAAGITIGGDNVAQPIDIGTNGGRTITVGNTTGTTGLVVNVGTGNATINLADSQAAAFSLTNTVGSATPLLVNTSLKTVEFEYDPVLQGDRSIIQTFGLNAVGAYAEFTLLTIDATTGKFSPFDCETDKSILGLATVASSGVDDPVAMAIGGTSKARFNTAPAAASIGAFVYALGATGSNSGKVGRPPPVARACSRSASCWPPMVSRPRPLLLGSPSSCTTCPKP